MLSVAWLAGEESNDKAVAITGELGSVNIVCGCWRGCDCCSAVDMAGGVISTFTSIVASDFRERNGTTTLDSEGSEDSSVINCDVLIEFLISDSSKLGNRGRRDVGV